MLSTYSIEYVGKRRPTIAFINSVKPTSKKARFDAQDLGLVEARYYDTYRVSNVIANILRDPFPYIRSLDEFYGDLSAYTFLEPFPRHSYFHLFIEFIIVDLGFDDLSEFDLEQARENEAKFRGFPGSEEHNYTLSPIERALDYHEIEHQSFRDWLSHQGVSFEDADADHLHDYYCELRLSGEFDELAERMTEEVFFIMFLNRQAMRDFNVMMGRVISEITLPEVDPGKRKFMKRDGVLRRVNPPIWAKKAVFFRERGKCALTRKDLSGLLSTLNRAHFDHIVPLAEGGLNDVTNLQLLAEDVNVKKAADNDETSILYEKWY